MDKISIADWIQIAIDIITFFGIIVSIIITIITLRKNSKTLTEANRAQIIFYIDYNPACEMYFLIIRNFGKSIGKLTKIDITPKLDWKKTRISQDMKPLTAAKNIMLAPNQKYVDKYTIDLNYISNIDWLFPHPIYDHTKDNKAVLYKINNSIRDLTDKFR